MERVLRRLVVPVILTLVFLATLGATPAAAALAETEQSCNAVAGADVFHAHARIRTHHAFPRCPEGEGFTEHNRRKQPTYFGATGQGPAGVIDAADAPAPSAAGVAAATANGRRISGNIPRSYDPQGPPVETA